MGPKIEIDIEWLREKYVDEWMTASEIAELAGASERTVRRRLEENEIERGSGKDKRPIKKEKLQHEYVQEGQSARDIARGEDYSRNHVQSSLEYHDIPIRGRSQAMHSKNQGCAFSIHPQGHVMVESGEATAYVHQIVAISDGADPYKVFSDGEYQCHHRNHIPWDNRPENIEVLGGSEHLKEHRKYMQINDEGRFVKKHLR